MLDFNLSLSQLGALFFLVSALPILYFVFHRLYLHPLAKYPGPWLAKLSNLYAGYHAWKGDVHLDMWRCHLKYGDNLRIYAYDFLLESDNGCNIYGQKKNVKKSKSYAGLVYLAANTFTLLGKTEHGRRRRVVGQGLSTSMIHSYQPKILKHIEAMCTAIRRGEVDVPVTATGDEQPLLAAGTWSQPIDMSPMCNYYVFDVMADVVFGLQYNLLSSTRWHYIWDCMQASNVRISFVVFVPKVKICRLDKWLFPKSIRGGHRFLRFVDGLVRSLGNGSEPKSGSVFSGLAEYVDPVTNTGLTTEQMVAESATLIMAGSDTTSTALAGIFFYLTRNAAAYEKVTKEIRETFQSIDEICLGTKLSSCVYLRACIDETMRMSPPIGSALGREVLDHGAEIDGAYIPAGCEVGTGIYSIHHHPHYYPNLSRFVPERWIDGENGVNAEDVERAQSAFTPMSLGPRSCIGRGLAYAEMQLLMASMIFVFDFKSESTVGEVKLDGEKGREKPWEYQLCDHITAVTEGPIVLFKERDLMA